MFYIANPDLKVGAIERTKTNRAGQLLRCFFSVALPFRAGVLKGKLSFFEGFSPFIFCFSEKSFKGLKRSKIMFYIANPDLKVGAIEPTKTNRAGQLPRCFCSIALPFRAGILKGKLSFFEGFSPFIFCFSEKSLKGLKPSKIMFYIATPDLKGGAIASLFLFNCPAL